MLLDSAPFEKVECPHHLDVKRPKMRCDQEGGEEPGKAAEARLRQARKGEGVARLAREGSKEVDRLVVTVQPAGVVRSMPRLLRPSLRRRETTRRATEEAGVGEFMEGAPFQMVEDGVEGLGGGDGIVLAPVLAEEPVSEGGGAEGDGPGRGDVFGARDMDEGIRVVLRFGGGDHQSS